MVAVVWSRPTEAAIVPWYWMVMLPRIDTSCCGLEAGPQGRSASWLSPDRIGELTANALVMAAPGVLARKVPMGFSSLGSSDGAGVEDGE